MAQTLTELVAKITTDASGLKSGLASADKSIGSFVNKNAAGLRSLGVAFTAMGAAIVGGLGASTKAAIDFETAFTGVRKTVEATDAEFATLRQGIRDLAKVLPLPAVEIAGIAQAAGQLGIEVPKIMEFTEVIVKLGMATDITEKEAAIMLAQFANVTGMDISNMDRLAAVIVDLGNNMATNEPAIVAMASRLSGVSAIVNISETSIMALSSALASLKIETQMGSTAVQRVFVKMNTAVLSGNENLTKFAEVAGMSAQEFATAFREDASSALISFIAGLKDVIDVGGNATGVLEDLGLADQRVLQVMLKSAGGIEEFYKAQGIANDAWEENIALDVEVAKRLEDTKAKMDIMKNVLIDLGITIGDFIIPLLKQFVEWLMPIIENVKTWIEENDELAKRIVVVAGVVGGLLLVLGPLLIMLPGIVTALGLVKAAWIGLTVAMTVNPIYLVILAITLLVAEIVWLMNNMDLMIHFWDDVFSNMKSIALKAFDVILAGAQKFLGFIPGMGDKIDELRDKLAGMIRSEELQREIRDMTRDILANKEALDENVVALDDNAEAIENSTEVTAENIEVLLEEQEALLATQEALEEQLTAREELLESIRDTRKEYEYERSDAGKLRITVKDVTFALLDMGWTNDELALTMKNLGDDVDDVNKFLKAVGLTAVDVNAILEAQSDEVTKLGDAYKIAREKAAGGVFSGEELPEPKRSGYGVPTGEAEFGAWKNLVHGSELGIEGYIAANHPGLDAAIRGMMVGSGMSYKSALGNIVSPGYSFASGGVVPGPVGTPVLATVHGGETIIPANESMGGVTVNISGPLFMEREDQMNQLVDKISKGIDRKQRLRFGGAYNG